jgi:hypothetical protein
VDTLIVALLLVLIVALAAVAFAARREARVLADGIGGLRRSFDEHAAHPPEFPPPPSLDPLREELAGLMRDLAERVGAIEGAIEALPPPEPPPAPVRVRVAEEVGPLLREVREILEARIAELRREVRERREEGVVEAIARALRARGFEGVEIVEGPEPDGARMRVTVEARRHGMTFKGPVLMEGSQVVDHGLKPATSMFP